MIGRVVQVCVLWAMVNVTDTCIICCHCGDVGPADPFVFVNETLEINCTLTSSNEIRNSSTLFFTHKQIPLDVRYYELPNNRTLSFRKVAEMADAGVYMCHRSDISGGMGIVGAQVVEIAYPPQKVTEIQCIWYNWRDILECSWELPAYNLREIEVQFSWYNGAFGQCPDMSPNMTTCTLRPSDASLDTYSWHFQVTVTNTRRNVSAVGPYIAKNQPENVKPDKVDSLDYNYTDDSTCIRLTWTCEAVTCVSSLREKQIRVRYVSSSGEPKEEVHEDPDRSVLVCDLDPDTLYTFTVDVKASSSPFYSDPVTIAARTDEDVPQAAPELHKGAYHRHSFSCLSDLYGYHDVTVYWKNIQRKEARGNIINYVVETSEVGNADEMDNTINITSDFTETYSMGTSLSGTVRLKCGSAYDIRIRASTKKGFSKSWSYMRIPTFSRKGPCPPSVRVEEGAGEYELTWTDSSLIGKTGYTVFYCQRKNNTHCKGTLMSVDVDRLDRHTTLAVPDTEVEYLFGVSCNFGLFGSGFNLVSCVYHKHAVPPPPSNIAISSKDHTGAIVTWNHVTCMENAPFIVTYTIRWCKVNKETSTEVESCNAKNVSIMAHGSALFVLDDINKEETYGVQIRSSSSIQTGVFSYPVYITLPKKDNEDTCQRTVYRTGDIIQLCLIVVIVLFFIICVTSLTCYFRHRIRRRKDVKLKF